MRILTANVVGLSFERYRFRRGLKRLFTHFVLFNFTFDKSGPAWRGLDSSEMESAVPNVVKRCWSEMHHYSITPAMLEKARQMETAERRVAGVRQTFRGLN